MRLNQAIKDFETYLKANSRSPHTIRSYLHDLQLFQNWLGANPEITSINSNLLHAFLASDVVISKPAGSPRAKGSVNKIKTSLKAFFAWLVQSEAITTNPAAGIRIKYYQRALPDILTEVEQKRLQKTLAQTKGRRAFRDRIIYTLLLNTGLRIRELVNLDIADINLAEKRLSITAKGNNEATRFLSTPAPAGPWSNTCAGVKNRPAIPRPYS